jgi:hypothetical protein
MAFPISNFPHLARIEKYTQRLGSGFSLITFYPLSGRTLNDLDLDRAVWAICRS